jgi:Lhr-like helicase
VVATGSLELGIDVGFVDCVVRSPRPSRSRGRCSGSAAPPRGRRRARAGRIVGTQRGDFLECAAVARRCCRATSRRPTPRRAASTCWRSRFVAEVAAAGADVPARELYRHLPARLSYRSLTGRTSPACSTCWRGVSSRTRCAR